MEGIVDIIMRKDGQVIATRHGRNVWVDIGREYLANLIALDTYDPDVVFDDRRVKYIGFGIGAASQQLLTQVNNPPISTAYPGSNTYKKEYPTGPLIEKLERPVRISGGSTAYPGAPADVWLKQPPVPGFRTIFPAGTTGEVVFRTVVDGTSGDIVYPPFTSMPLSEIGLFLSDADVNAYDGNLVAYFSFVTILFPAGAQLEVSWKVRFR